MLLVEPTSKVLSFVRLGNGPHDQHEPGVRNVHLAIAELRVGVAEGEWNPIRRHVGSGRSQQERSQPVDQLEDGGVRGVLNRAIGR